MKHPLTQEHCDCLNKALEGSRDVLEYLQACKDCGLPVDEMIADVKTMQQQCTAIKAKFFPMNP